MTSGSLTIDEQIEVLEGQLALLRTIRDRRRAAARDEGIDQSASPLGARRHCAATKRRIAAGLDGAWIIGRKHYLSRGAIAEELKALSSKKTEPSAPEPESVADELRAELGLHVVCGGKR